LSVNFASDNTTGASPEILHAIVAANSGSVMPYGNDDLTKDVESRICEIFETDAAVFLIATGSAANSLALSVMTPSYGSVLCHWTSHIYEDECGAPEFFTNGARMVPVGGELGKLDVTELELKAGHGAGDVHMLQPSAASITQVSELGTVYSADEINTVSEICRRHRLKLHMDGARFTGALSALGGSPAELTWKAGVDVLSFGATKNGALGVEAVVYFDKALAETFALRRKRGGHLFSKMRLLSAQMMAYLSDDLWLRNAEHANAMAARLHGGLAGVTGIEFPLPVDANMMFPVLPKAMVDGLHADGFEFYDGRWEGGMSRLVTAFNTRAEDVDAFIETAKKYAG
jgi:threonine aldolase